MTGGHQIEANRKTLEKFLGAKQQGLLPERLARRSAVRRGDAEDSKGLTVGDPGSGDRHRWGQGLGRAFCLAFLAQSGVPVVVADIDGDRAAAVTAWIVGRGGRPWRALTWRPGRRQGPRRRPRVRSIGVLVDGAGDLLTLVRKPFTEIEPDEWRRVLRASTCLARSSAARRFPTMAGAGYGKIVNISSATIWIGGRWYLHYVTSKAALIGMTRALASEIGPFGIRVNAITPGSTQTEVERETISVADRQAMAVPPPFAVSRPADDLVGAVLFLSSPPATSSPARPLTSTAASPSTRDLVSKQHRRRPLERREVDRREVVVGESGRRIRLADHARKAVPILDRPVSPRGDGESPIENTWPALPASRTEGEVGAPSGRHHDRLDLELGRNIRVDVLDEDATIPDLPDERSGHQLHAAAL